MNLADAATRLSALAVGLCQDAGIGLEVGDVKWAWDSVRRVILVPQKDMEERGPEYCAGVLAHEIGHYFISRYLLFRVDFPSQVLLFFLLNGIEDPRVNTWIRLRYPGTDAWLAKVAEEDAHMQGRAALPDVLHFIFSCAREEWLGWRPAATVTPLPQRVIEALDQTRPARRRYAETLPPADLDPGATVSGVGRRYRLEVWTELASTISRILPSLREQAVQLCAREAIQLAEQEIFPTARALLDGDVSRLMMLLHKDPALLPEARRAADEADQARLEVLFTRAREQPAPAVPLAGKPQLQELALRLVEAWVRAWQGACSRSSPVIGTPDDAARAGRKPGLPQPPPTTPPPKRPPRLLSDYDRAQARVAPQIERLTRHIEEILQPVQRLREGRGFPSGHKLDLRRLMAYEADPRIYNKLWLRKSIPQRRRAVVSLLVDLSGSMQGAKTEAALAGTVLLAECLHRLSVPFAVNGFQDVLVPLCDFGAGLGPDVRMAIGQLPLEVEGRRPHGNNMPRYNDDGPCLLEAAEGLLARNEADRLLIVVSDGLPEGRRSNEGDLRNAVQQLSSLGRQLKLVGIGLGPQTDHVSKYYPESIANVPLERFADEIGGLLERVLLSGAPK
jgi:hypothetical protein